MSETAADNWIRGEGGRGRIENKLRQGDTMEDISKKNEEQKRSGGKV
jgi:hypothetical protein